MCCGCGGGADRPGHSPPMLLMLLSALMLATAAIGPLATPPACASHGSGATGYLSGTQNVSINVTQSDGRQVERTFVLFVPFSDGSPSCMSPGPPETPRPLVLNWHGCNRHLPVVDYHLDISRLNEAAADYSWFTMHPVGTSLTPGSTLGWNALGCCGCNAAGIDDFAFAEAMIDWAAAHLCVDLSRVFTTGFSNGGFMAYSLACRMGHRLAGVAAMAGSIAKRELDSCADPALRSLPVLSFHSLADKYVPYDGNALDASQKQTDAMFRARAGCTGAEPSRVTFRSQTTTCERVECVPQGGAPPVPIETCTLLDLDHCWVGGRSGGFNQEADCMRRAGDPDATRRMFDFWSAAANVTNPEWLARDEPKLVE